MLFAFVSQISLAHGSPHKEKEMVCIRMYFGDSNNFFQLTGRYSVSCKLSSFFFF